jgi:type IV pilus biogenesis protein CpaD/CtpE
MKKMNLATVAAAAAILSGCASKGPDMAAAKEKAAGPQSGILLLDSKPAPGKSRDDLIQELTEAARMQVDKVAVTSVASRFPLASVKPAFSMKAPASNATSFAITSLFGKSVKELTCENAVATIRGINSDAQDTGAQANLTICLSQYNGGYHTGVQASFEKTSMAVTSIFKKKGTIDGDLFVRQTLDAVRAAVERNTTDTKVLDPRFAAQ